MSINSNSLAAAVGAGVKNKTFKVSANVVPQKNLIIGTFDPLKTGIVADEPIQVFSEAQVGSLCGFGFPIHRIAVRTFEGNNGDVETWIIPQDESGAQASGSITFVATSVSAGTIQLYIAGISVPINVIDGDAAADIATKCVAAITANTSLPVTAIATLGVVDITAKDSSTFGNEVTIRFNIKAGEEFPTGLTSAVIVDMTGGTGTTDISTALDALGVGDAANEAFFTCLGHTYLQDTATLDAISAYVGEGNDFIGLYDKLVARPFRSLTGDTAEDTAGLTALIAISDLRKEDRANGIVAVPDSADHPSEIAAFALGIMARKNNILAENSYIGEPLSSVDPGNVENRWTNDYNLGRDLAVKSGISPTKVESNVVLLQNVVTFYRPDDVAAINNGYRSMRNISILQNIMNAVRANFSREEWQGFSVVEDVTQVTNVESRLIARDTDSVLDDLVALAQAFASRAWIYSSEFTINKLKEADSVTIRASGNGFDNLLRVQLSGEGAILDTVTEFDTAISV